jgi:hypothetical protein
MAKRKRTNNDLQNTTQKTKDRAIYLFVLKHLNLLALVLKEFSYNGDKSLSGICNLSQNKLSR